MKYLFFTFFFLNAAVVLSQDLDTSPEVKQLAAGTGHGMALLINGTIWAWGRNTTGQLGDGSRLDKYIPVMIGSDTNWSCITAGNAFSHAVKTDGTLWGRGNNKIGQLGISAANVI